MKNKAGICPICHKEHKTTKKHKMMRHGFTYKRDYKKFKGFFETIIYRMILIDPPCIGSWKKAEKIIEIESK